MKRKFAVTLLLFLLLTPVVAAAELGWVKGLDNALERAARENKFVVLDISATW